MYEKQVKETKLLERIEDLILWTLSTFKRPAEETQRLREADTEDGYFLSELGRGLVEDLAKAKSPELERLMGCVGHMLAGEIAQACDLLGVLFGAVLRKGSRAYEATVAFPELQFWFVGALKRFVGRDNDRFYKIIYHRYWEQIFSEDLMFIGKTGDAAPLPATRMHVLLRQRLVLFVFELMDIGEGHKVVLAKAHETFDSSAKSPCVEEHVICVETAASVLSKLALNGSPVAAKDLQALPTFLIEPKSFKDRLAAVSEDPAFDSIRIRYSTARSGMMNSMVKKKNTHNINTNRLLIIL